MNEKHITTELLNKYISDISAVPPTRQELVAAYLRDQLIKSGLSIGELSRHFNADEDSLKEIFSGSFEIETVAIQSLLAVGSKLGANTSFIHSIIFDSFAKDQEEIEIAMWPAHDIIEFWVEDYWESNPDPQCGVLLTWLEKHREQGTDIRRVIIELAEQNIGKKQFQEALEYLRIAELSEVTEDKTYRFDNNPHTLLAQWLTFLPEGSEMCAWMKAERDAGVPIGASLVKMSTTILNVNVKTTGNPDEPEHNTFSEDACSWVQGSLLKDIA